ncbi:hypothetical protein [Kaistella palustris]|uniref:hypothetical protein n=1 Tax=Kaistella palustris TaxID=493376 RepID=UPI0003F92C1C|nr:hypothetical protein [Kaistella palustris]
MFGLILALGILIFGFFLETTKTPGFESSKKFAWMFIAIGVLTVIGKLVIMYQKGEL